GVVVCWGSNSVQQTVVPPIVNGTTGTARAIAAGGFHTCAIASTGAPVCWGFDGSGQSSVPILLLIGPVVDIAAGLDHSRAIREVAHVVMWWGSNPSGQSTPPDAVNGVDGTAIAVAAGQYHSCAIQAETHAVVCWGPAGVETTPPDS